MSADSPSIVRPTNPRYTLRAATYTWHNKDGSPSPGVGIFTDRRLVQHLTLEQALALADQLVDATEERETHG